MRIAIIGGGITGLTAAYELTKKGHRVTVFEKEKTLGGLAHGFKPASTRHDSTRGGKSGWDWHLESAYHHLFTNDHAIINLMKELGLSDKLILTRPTTANALSRQQGARVTILRSTETLPQRAITLLKSMIGKVSLSEEGDNLQGHDRGSRTSPKNALPEHVEIYPFDSPTHLLNYPGLSLLDKIRTGILVVSIKLNPFWQPLEWMTAKKLFFTMGGKRAWEILWEPLMIGKFGPYADSIAASWLWARIKKRTQKLYYIEGGFHTLISALEQTIKAYGGTIVTDTAVVSIKETLKDKYLVYWKEHKHDFDRVLFTTPTEISYKIFPKILNTSTQHLLQIPHLHAQTLILETDQPILKDTYWLNIMDRTFPFLAVVAHTNMVDKKYYGGHHLTYFGNYLPSGHPYLSMTKKQLLNVFLPFINRLNPSFLKSSVIRHTSFTAPFAQPVHEVHYSRRAPKLETPIPGIFLANMDSIYPWDRGTNYAVELGIRAGRVIIQSDQYMRKQID